MKKILWNEEKNEWLKKERGLNFELVAQVIADNGIITIIPHHNQNKYPNQRIFILDIYGYVCCVPFVEDEEKIFLKTIYPSSEYNKIYNLKG